MANPAQKDLPDSPTPPAPRRMRKRIAIPTGFIVVVVLLLLWGTIRGNWADSRSRNPSSAADGAWKVNRGSWVLTQHGAGETLLEYNLELRVSPFPDFVIRAVLLDQLKPVMRAVASRVARNPPPR